MNHAISAPNDQAAEGTHSERLCCMKIKIIVLVSSYGTCNFSVAQTSGVFCQFLLG